VAVNTESTTDGAASMTILCYHSVDPAWESPLAMRPGEFEEHAAWLARRRTVVPLSEAVKRLDSKGRLPRGMAALTFDDGFTGVLEHAVPAVQRHGLPMTVFLVAQTLSDEGLAAWWVRTPPPWPLTTLTVDEVLHLRDLGVDFQSHSWAHRDLPELDEEACERDLRQSREFLEDLLHASVPYLAYPRGLHDAAVRRAAHRAGYSHGFTLPEGPEAIDEYAVPRVGVHRGNRTRTLAIKAQRRYLDVRHSRLVRAVG
jgi:peptidoglycan/xylan/chitin deacetylase (PgdA/CDA1 family)